MDQVGPATGSSAEGRAGGSLSEIPIQCPAIRVPQSETSTQMHALGLITSQGRDVRTNIKAYFLNITQGFDIRESAAKTVDIKDPKLIKARNALQNTIATGRNHYILREVFGPGVFLLLPEQALGQ